MRAGYLRSDSYLAASFNELMTLPIIISSQIWSPQRTSFLGSGMAGSSLALSKCATQCNVASLNPPERVDQGGFVRPDTFGIQPGPIGFVGLHLLQTFVDELNRHRPLA